MTRTVKHGTAPLPDPLPRGEREKRFTRAFTAMPADIDALGHVNNAVWVRWIQELAVAHWAAVAPAEQQAAYVWVVTRHEVDYRGNVAVGETVSGETWVPEPPKGARFDRHVRFTGSDGRVKVEAVTTWALLDRATGRLLRVRPEIAAPFLSMPTEQRRAPVA
ncbi:acyl-CoA thioesterase [Sphingomonas sp.]|uniref:acyl-CoA thioesterase n=1 Tax=Sphingomonas sp. TaxID=28214 RepID=UPI0033416E0C